MRIGQDDLHPFQFGRFHFGVGQPFAPNVMEQIAAFRVGDHFGASKETSAVSVIGVIVGVDDVFDRRV